MPSEVPDITRLYDAHARQVWRALIRLGVNSWVVEDAVQDVFLIAHQRFASFQGRSSEKTWLIGIAVHVAANLRRAAVRRGTLRLLDEPPADPAATDPEKDLERRRKLVQLEAVLGGLPDEQREAVVLVDLEQLSVPEAAEALEVKLNTLYSRLRLGRAALHRALSGAQQEVAS